MSIEQLSFTFHNFWNKVRKISQELDYYTLIYSLFADIFNRTMQSRPLKRNWTFHILTNWSTLMVMDSHRKIMETWVLFQKACPSIIAKNMRGFNHFIFNFDKYLQYLEENLMFYHSISFSIRNATMKK